MIKFLIGGSPCTHWSIAQSKAEKLIGDAIIDMVAQKRGEPR